MVFFIIGFFLPIIMWFVTLGLKVTLKSYMLLMDGEEGQLSHNLYNKLSSRNRGIIGSIGSGIRNVKKLGEAGYKTAKTAYKIGKTAVKLSIKAIKLAIAVIKFIIASLKALIAIISASTVGLVILIILLLVVLIAAVVTVIIGNENAKDGKVNFTKTKVSEMQGSKGKTSDSDDGTDTAYSEDVATRIVQVASDYAKDGTFHYVYGGKGGTSKAVDCSAFAEGCILEATGYSYSGKKGSKNFKLSKNALSFDYAKTSTLWGISSGKIFVKRASGSGKFTPKEILDYAKPGDMLVRNGHVAIYYGEVKGKPIKIHASTGDYNNCSKSPEDALKGNKDRQVGFGVISSSEFGLILRPAKAISKLNK